MRIDGLQGTKGSELIDTVLVIQQIMPAHTPDAANSGARGWFGRWGLQWGTKGSELTDTVLVIQQLMSAHTPDAASSDVRDRFGR